MEAACEIVKSFVDYALHAKFLVRCVVVATGISRDRVRDRGRLRSSIAVVAQVAGASSDRHIVGIARFDANKAAYGQCSSGRGPVVRFGRDGSRLRNRQILLVKRQIHSCIGGSTAPVRGDGGGPIADKRDGGRACFASSDGCHASVTGGPCGLVVVSITRVVDCDRNVGVGCTGSRKCERWRSHGKCFF